MDYPRGSALHFIPVCVQPLAPLCCISYRRAAAAYWAAFSVSLCVLVLCHTLGIVYAAPGPPVRLLSDTSKAIARLLRRSLCVEAPPRLRFRRLDPAILSQATLATPYRWIQPQPSPDLLRASFCRRWPLPAPSPSRSLRWLPAIGRDRHPVLLTSTPESRDEDRNPMRRPVRQRDGPDLACVKLVYPFSYPATSHRICCSLFAIVAAASALFSGSPLVRLTPPFRLAAVLMIGDAASRRKRTCLRALACMDDDGRKFAELALSFPKLPIVTESPQAWFPSPLFGISVPLGLDWDG